ncbi:Clp protease N-terminal domain-containing protein [Candidatus Obscuribacterales bacterium]|nr:Clp protease N-terminal domain-containing protein [Candidatus Obscuribacterales bacterium]MBX3153790.1 Clp protease N-terminal domain-containing protein [Candidatus Obscuribacterales bacterium]
MIDTVFERAGESLLSVVQHAMAECLNMGHSYVCTQHLLVALTADPDSLAAHALETMKMDEESVRNEVERQFKDNPESELLYSDRPDVLESGFPKPAVQPQSVDQPIGFSDLTVQALTRAFDYSLFFGETDIEPVHLLLGILDLSDATAIKVFEDMGANLTFLRREILIIMAVNASLEPELPTLRDATVSGMRELIDRLYGDVRALSQLAVRSRLPLSYLPSRLEIVHRVCVAYFADFLWTQVSFKRYLLDETLDVLSERVGSLDQKVTASIVSQGAQNLREEVRTAFEYMLSNEYRLFDKMMDEAEYDEIGTVIEELWWTQGEEIALHELFIEALDDHRRQQMLGLQKQRIEISERLARIKVRLDETVRECFEKRSVSPA